MMLIPVLAGFGSFASETPTVEIVSNNVWYGETLNLMYAIKAENAEGYTFEVTANGEAVSTYFSGKEEIKGVECDVYIVTKGVAAQNIDTVYTATVTCGSASDTTTYSVLEYLNERLYISDDTTAATLMGVSVKKTYAIAMGIAMATAAVAGLGVGMRWTFYPSSGGSYLLIAFGVVVIGGMGSIPGTLVAGLVFGLAQVIGGAQYGTLISYILLILMLAVRPQGLFSK